MYSWYFDASVCYAYLEDILSDSALEKSKWFSRGWTLQELIVPRRLIFFNGQWEAFGSKKSLAERISPITCIPLDILLGKSPLCSTVAQRMSWASKRQTTREEEMAYSLMGLFDIHMPPIYGEGSEKAFLRLQEEILGRNSDQTLFIWGRKHEPYNHGLLATSPAAFCDETQCFRWLPHEGLKLENPNSPYSSLVPVSYRPTTLTYHKDGVTPGVTQTSIGSYGLQISLLQDSKSVYATERPNSTVACLDVMVVGKNSPHNIILHLIQDIIRSDIDGFIPNRLGDWRGPISLNKEHLYGLVAPGSSFTRANMTISQLRTSTCGPGKPGLFRLEDSKTVSLVSGITTIEMGDPFHSFTPTTETFECSGAVIALRHFCHQCRKFDVVEIMFGTQQHSSPWCNLIWRPRDSDIRKHYNKAEKLSSRFYEQSKTFLGCGKQAIVHIFSEEDGQCYFIRIDIVN